MKIKKANIFIKIVILALIAYACVSIVNVRRSTEAAQADLERLQAELVRTEQTNAELRYDMAHATDESTIESIAREKLGLVNTGEKVYIDING